jgi:hypothetical protein
LAYLALAGNRFTGEDTMEDGADAIVRAEARQRAVSSPHLSAVSTVIEAPQTRETQVQSFAP